MWRNIDKIYFFPQKSTCLVIIVSHFLTNMKQSMLYDLLEGVLDDLTLYSYIGIGFSKKQCL